jgi:multiple sugar transport system permease protein/cellobiose transport system permease protein
MFLFVVITLLPFYAMFIMGTYDSYQMFTFNGLPSNYLLHNLNTVMKTDIFRYFLNSITVSASCVVFGTLGCALCGYGMAKYKFAGRKILFGIILLTMMVPSQLGIVVYVFEMRALHLNDTLIPTILPFLCSGFGAFWMSLYIKDAVPDEIIESARIDGANEFKIFSAIVCRLITPALLTVALLLFIWSWNNFLVPLVTIMDAKKYTLPLGMAMFNGLYSTDNGAKIVALSISTVPLLLVYLFASNSFMSGLTEGAVKG